MNSTLVGKFLRELRPGLLSSLFWHIPFPPPELFAFLPWKREILEGLLGNAIIGFHTSKYCRNFGRCAKAFLDAEWNEAAGTVSHEGRGRVSVIQIAVPSRTHIVEYQQIIANVNREVGRINGLFSRDGYPQRELVAFYRAADEGGMLVLSEHAGTAEAFPEIVSVNPFDIDATASASAVMRRMREQVKTQDLEWWIRENITALRAVL